MALYKIRLTLEWDETSQAYAVSSPDVPGLNTFGANMAEIRSNVADALETLLEYMDSEGLARPAALQQPVDETNLETDLLVTVDTGIMVNT